MIDLYMIYLASQFDDYSSLHKFPSNYKSTQPQDRVKLKMCIFTELRNIHVDKHRNKNHALKYL
uniref:Uncharacterized protein n=1 Tax=Anguilla anguilla TaxID=7936 RepID=A0A0E9XBB2_ANGAN